MDDIIQVMFHAYIDFDTARIFTSVETKGYKGTDKDLWIESWKQIDKKLPPLKKELEKFLREILTINKNS